MALTLAANIDATQRYITVTGAVPSDLEQGRQFRIGDELVEFFGFDQSTVPLIVAYLAGTRTNWRVTRGVGESVAASHLSGVALLGAQDAFASGSDQNLPGPFPEGGGGPLTTMHTLTAEDINGLADVPVVILPAVADNVIVPIAVWAVYHYGTVKYSFPGEPVVAIDRQDDSTKLFVCVAATWLWNVEADGFAQFTLPAALLDAGAVGQVAGITGGLRIKFVDQAPNGTPGDGTVDVYVSYYLQPV